MSGRSNTDYFTLELKRPAKLPERLAYRSDVSDWSGKGELDESGVWLVVTVDLEIHGYIVLAEHESSCAILPACSASQSGSIGELLSQLRRGESGYTGGALDHE